MSRLVSAEELLIVLNSNATLLHCYNIVKAVLFQLVTFIKLEGILYGPFQSQCF